MIFKFIPGNLYKTSNLLLYTTKARIDKANSEGWQPMIDPIITTTSTLMYLTCDKEYLIFLYDKNIIYVPQDYWFVDYIKERI
jgi:hypothetical protein